jgi:hypothetical protein
MPRLHVWLLIAGAIGIGALIAAPFALLLMFHEGPWSGFLWDLLNRLPFLMIVIVLLTGVLQSFRSGKRKDAALLFLVLIFFGLLGTLAWFEFVRHMQSLVHFHRLQPLQVREVRVACHTTTDPLAVQQIMTDLQGAQWYSPDSHGWSPYADLTIEFADGRTESYALTKILAEGRLVVNVHQRGVGWVLLAVPNLADSMQQASLLKTASYPRYDNKGLYQAIVPTSVCKQE